MATILLPDTYLMRFNSPRTSRHEFKREKFPDAWRRIWLPLHGVAVWNPLQEFDLMHSFFKIPFTKKPWILSFSSFVPRTIGKYEKVLREVLRDRLLEDNCRKLIACSNFAKREFALFNHDWSGLDQAMRKIEIVHPNLPVQVKEPKRHAGDAVSLVFVGNDFARKGGVIALRVAKIAQERHLPVQVHIVSKMSYGGDIYTDCPDRSKYAQDIELLDLDNVTFHGALPNAKVLQLLSDSDFQFMPTIHDTYGYSVLEGFSVGTPAIATAVCALTEIVSSEENGHLLSMPTDENGKWIHLKERSWEILDATYSRLANETIAWLEAFLDCPDQYQHLSAGAIKQIRDHHESGLVGRRLDDIYSAAIT